MTARAAAGLDGLFATRLSVAPAVRVYVCDNQSPPSAEDLAMLSVEERRSAERFRFSADRCAFVNSRARLRRLLGAHMNAPPQRLMFCRGPHGKPTVPGLDLAFNLSHCRGRTAIALAPAAVGIDIERRDRIAGWPAWSDTVASAEELRDWYAHPQGLLALWVLKEALGKAAGVGLTPGPERLGPIRPRAVQCVPFLGARYVVRQVPLGDAREDARYVIGLAVRQ